MSRAGIFLDRDGTINVKPPDHDYVATVSDFAWLPRAREAVSRLSRAGYVIAVVSNQRGVARRLVSPAFLDELENKIQADLAPYGCRIDAFRYCTHDVDARCRCRKPAPGMLLAIAEELQLDLSRSWMIGDMESDVLAGKAAGCRTIRIAPPTITSAGADLVAPSLDDASRLVTAGPSSR